jgi:hypothetical protein
MRLIVITLVPSITTMLFLGFCLSHGPFGYPVRGGPTPTINDDKTKIRPSVTRGINQVEISRGLADRVKKQS